MSRRQITIEAGKDNKVLEMPRITAEVEGVLALHRGYNQELWSITHLETGKRVTWFHKRILAYGCMIELAHSVDWSEVKYSDRREDQERTFEILKPILARWREIDKREHDESEGNHEA